MHKDFHDINIRTYVRTHVATFDGGGGGGRREEKKKEKIKGEKNKGEREKWATGT